jgi:hypothetical protein
LSCVAGSLIVDEKLCENGGQPSDKGCGGGHVFSRKWGSNVSM